MRQIYHPREKGAEILQMLDKWHGMIHIFKRSFPHFRLLFHICSKCGKRKKGKTLHRRFSTFLGQTAQKQAIFCGKSCGNCGKPSNTDEMFLEALCDNFATAPRRMWKTRLNGKA